MRNSSPLSLFISILWLSLLILCEPCSLAATKSASQSANLIIQTNAKEAFVTVQGSRRSIGQNIRLTAGWREVQIAAPAMGTRKLRYWLQDGETLRTQADLAPLLRPQIPLEWKSADRVLTPAQRAKTAATCKWFQERHVAKTLCKRESWLEDLHYAEPDPFDSEELRDLEKQGELETYRKLVSRRELTELTVSRDIETFYASHAKLPAAFRLAAHHSLIQGDCPRVHSIFIDAQQTLQDLRPLAFYKAFCAELQGQQESSMSLLRDALALGDAPYLRYHLGRQLLISKPAEALLEAQSCIRRNQEYLPCQELGMMASTILQKPYKMPKIKYDEGAFKAFLSLEEALKEKRYDSSFRSLSHLLSSQPHALELYLMLSWLEATQNFGTSPQFLEQKLSVSQSLAPSTLDILIETLEKREMSRLLPPVYANKLRSHPEDPNLWIRLVRAYSQAGQCSQALAAIKQGSQVLPKFNLSLLDIKGRCLLQIGQASEATETIETLIQLSPPSWELYMLLGKSLDLQKKSKPAREAYRKALDMNPPPAIRDELIQKSKDN